MSDTFTGEFRRVFLVYCLQRLPDGAYIALNRNYKPVGDMRKEWIDYEHAPGRFRFKRQLTAGVAAKLSCKGDPSLDCIYLYSDGCVPTASGQHWQAWSRRMQLLAGLMVEG